MIFLCILVMFGDFLNRKRLMQRARETANRRKRSAAESGKSF
jgi:hypothetical protein